MADLNPQDRLKRNIGKMYLLNFLRNLEFFGAVLVPFFLDWVRVDYTRMMVLQSWYLFWFFALEIPTGIVADRWGRKWSLASGAFFWVICMAIYGTARSYPIFFLAEFLGALGGALLSGADRALIYDTLKRTKDEKESRHIFSKYDAAGAAGRVIALIAGGLLAGSAIVPYPKTLPLTFLLTALPLIPSVLISITLEEPTRKKIRQKRWMLSGYEGLLHIFKHRKLRMLAANLSLIEATTFFMFWAYQALANEAGIPVGYNGFIAAAFNITAIILLLNLRNIERVADPKRLLFLTSIIPGLVFIGLGLTSSKAAIVLGAIVVVSLSRLRAPVLNDFMNRHISCGRRATVLSGVFMISQVIRAVLYPLVGYLTDISLKYSMIFLGVITIIFALAVRVEARHISKT